ncbi:MAG: hypothetical protein RLY95_415 [Pseudomonadota bacterium]|jgi:hypothetical protein
MSILQRKHHLIKPMRRAQRGLIGILLLVTIAVMAVAVFSKNIWGEDSKTYQQKVNREALLQAKAALLDYLAVGNVVSGNINDPFANSGTSYLGRLPCPDQLGKGQSDSPCGIGTAYKTAGYHSLGLFPWATINSPVIRDASHQCLWYAVDGLFKVSPGSKPVNSDSYGSFSVVQPVKPTNQALLNTTWPAPVLAGNITATGSSLDRVVAVIIASGAAGGLQTQTSIGGTTYTCGLTRTVSGVPNAEASAADFLKFYSSTMNNQSLLPTSNVPTANLPNPAATPSGALQTFVTADVDQEQLNDQIVWITAEDLAKATTKRIAQLYANQINIYVGKTGFYPWAAATPGGPCKKGLLQGFVPYTCDVVPSGATNANSISVSLGFGSSNFFNDVDYWAGQAHYAVTKDCTPSTASAKTFSGQDYPVVGSGGSTTHPCTGTDRINLGFGTNGPAAIILMRGRARASQLANATPCVAYDATNKAATSNVSLCLEDPTNIATVGTAFTTPKSSPTLMYGTAPYRIPQTSGTNDYMVQFTTN